MGQSHCRRFWLDSPARCRCLGGLDRRPEPHHRCAQLAVGLFHVSTRRASYHRPTSFCFAWAEHRRTGHVRQLGTRRDQCSNVEADQTDRNPSPVCDCISCRSRPRDGGIMISRAGSKTGAFSSAGFEAPSDTRRQARDLSVLDAVRTALA